MYQWHVDQVEVEYWLHWSGHMKYFQSFFCFSVFYFKAVTSHSEVPNEKGKLNAKFPKHLQPDYGTICTAQQSPQRMFRLLRDPLRSQHQMTVITQAAVLHSLQSPATCVFETHDNLPMAPKQAIRCVVQSRLLFKGDLCNLSYVSYTVQTTTPHHPRRTPFCLQET